VARLANIGSAQIANGAITNAKIGTAQVDTLQIKGQAVTVPSKAERTSPLIRGDANTSGQYATLVSLTVYHGEAFSLPSLITIGVTAQLVNESDSDQYFFARLLLNGSMVFGVGGVSGSNERYVSRSDLENISNGDTLTLQVATNRIASRFTGFIIALGTKR